MPDIIMTTNIESNSKMSKRPGLRRTESASEALTEAEEFGDVIYARVGA